MALSPAMRGRLKGPVTPGKEVSAAARALQSSMRYATFRLAPDDVGVHPIDARLFEADGVRREAIRQVNLLNDDTCVVLYELGGDLDRADEVLADSEDVVGHDVTGGDQGLAYIHFEANETVRTLLDIVDDNEIVLDTPIECAEDGALRFTLIGEQDAISRSAAYVPDRLTLSLEGIGDYHPDADDLYGALTDRQQEILEAAVERGYYEEPRSTTHEEIADAVGLTAGTVGEHLRKAEEKILSSVVSS